MERMTVKLVREYLEKKHSIIVPIGVIEQHGYHLPLKTDAILAEGIGRLIGERTGILVAPVIYSSFSGGGLPGTINISPAVMSLVVSDTLLSLASQGFRNFYLFLCHGGSENDRALDNALKLLLRTNPAFSKSMIALMPVWKFGSDPTGWSKAIREHDWHAGWLETSLIMALAPDLVRMDDMETDPEPLLSQQIEHPDNYQHAEKIVDDAMVVARQGQRPAIKVGVMGHPESASPELGRRIIEDVVRDAAKKIMEIEAKADGVYREVAFTPDPIMLT
ncbi:MAG: creatininase family protein [Nanoarchaeota archaeon]|nr:creatininase family protein [Nanoarchaeota archaeon]